MSRVSRAVRSSLRRSFPRSATFEGDNGTAWFVGFDQHAPSIAAFFCGDSVRSGPRGRVWSGVVPNRVTDLAESGGLPILRLDESDHRFDEIRQRAVSVPSMVNIHVDLPDDPDALRAQLLTSTTREDFRRIRRANFSYRVTSDPESVREFHARHYLPLLANRFPEDGVIRPVGKMLASLDQGGELVCVDIDGEWVAGIFNLRSEPSYTLLNLGIRDADDAVRQKRVVSAIIVRSLERAVELGRKRATLGRSLPFLGKGPVWFKAKWGGVITRDPATKNMQMVMDLSHESVRGMLSASPVIHVDGDALVVSKWLEPGDKFLQETARDAGRFPGISRWYVLAKPETLAAGAGQLSSSSRIVPVPVTVRGDRPVWLGEVLGSAVVRSDGSGLATQFQKDS